VPLVDQWALLEADLPPGWGTAALGLELTEGADGEAASALLAPLQPLLTEPGRFAIRITRDGSGPGVDALRRGLARLDRRGIDGRLSLVASERTGEPPAAAPAPGLVESWGAALATVPADWSDLLAEVELDSSDYLDRAAVLLAPLNPLHVGPGSRLRFRSARRFGYGASAGVVRACLERCERDGVRGRVRILEALSDTQPVGTQGPVWRIGGKTA
jgi:hypothetical protein